MRALSAIKKKLDCKDLQGVKELADFFKEKGQMTFYEFSTSNIIPSLLTLLLAENNSFEQVSAFMQTYFHSFYQESTIKGLETMYNNLLDFISRAPEVSQIGATDPLARTSFVQELKFLSTPLKIKVNFNQSIAHIIGKDDFLEMISKEIVQVDNSIKGALYGDIVSILNMFKASFLKQMNIWLQVERFASLRSVEKYLIDKFCTKILMTSNEEFAKKRAKIDREINKDYDGGSPNKNGIIDFDKEKILTSSYLEKKLEEQNKISKEKDIRKYFEVAGL